MTDVALALGAFVVMEPVTYLLHRFVFHGIGMRIHRSHHVPGPGMFELNDLYPLSLAFLTMGGMAAGTFLPSLRPLLLVGVGMTMYGAAYLFVHEIYIHQRIHVVRRRVPVLEFLASAHALHHRYGGEPYGMLFPVVPSAVRSRAAAS